MSRLINLILRDRFRSESVQSIVFSTLSNTMTYSGLALSHTRKNWSNGKLLRTLMCGTKLQHPNRTDPPQFTTSREKLFPFFFSSSPAWNTDKLIVVSQFPVPEREGPFVHTPQPLASTYKYNIQLRNRQSGDRPYFSAPYELSGGGNRPSVASQCSAIRIRPQRALMN